MKTHLFKSALVFLGLCAAGMAQTVVDVVVSKQQSFLQIDDSTTSDNGWAGLIFVDGNSGTPDDISGITAPTYTTPLPDSGTLTYDAGSDQWITSASFGSKEALDAAFPNGTYTVTVNGAVVSLDLLEDAYPNTPLATVVSAGSFWLDGKLYIDPTQSLTITTNMASFGESGGHLGLNVDGNFAMSVTSNFSQFGASGISGELSFDADSFISGQSYTVEMQFNNVVYMDGDNNPNDPSDISTNVGVYTTFTTFTITAIPEPAAFASFAGVLALTGVLLARRRQRGLSGT